MSDTIVAVLGGEPAWDALPVATPGGVRVLLERCLQKDAKRRLRDIGDARIAIDQLGSRSGETAVTPQAPRHPRSSRPTYVTTGVVVLAFLLLAGGVGLFYSAMPLAPVTSPSEYTQITNFTDSAVAPSLSPDGRMVTFIRGGEFFFSSGQIYVKSDPAALTKSD